MLDVPKDLPDTSPRVAKAGKRDTNDLAIAGLGAAPVELAADGAAFSDAAIYFGTR